MQYVGKSRDANTLRVCLQKIPKGTFNILPRESSKYSGDPQGAPFTTIPPRLFHRLPFFLDHKQLKSNRQTNNIKNTVNGLPTRAP